MKDFESNGSPRNMRVFISSTFRDMQEDRDHLIKFSFPQLRKRCEERAVTWAEIDLRWGIPDEDSEAVLPLCLEQIQRCRPFFVGLLGERYGHTVKTVSKELVERFPWLSSCLGRSITEMEILHGVLNDPAMHGHAYFYFRDPDYIKNLHSGLESPDFVASSADSHEKLIQLKNRIREASDAGICTLREGYRDPEQLGQWVLEDLGLLINDLFPSDDPLDPSDRETEAHMLFAKSRVQAFVERPEDFEKLDLHVRGDGPPMVVTGEPGIGKSALLANWFLRYQEKNPENLVLAHFVGATADSADASLLMLRVIRLLNNSLGLEDEVIPPDQIPDVFSLCIDRFAGSRRIVLVIDALNQLYDGDGAGCLGWLPSVFPKNWRVILSTSPGRSLDTLKKRNWHSMAVSPLAKDERIRLLEKYLGRSGRRLSPDRVGRIADAAPCENPLFLRSFLDELRQFGENNKLEEHIDFLLAASNLGQLYERIFGRWEVDFGRELVRDFLVFLWSARHGLSEAELLDLLGPKGEPLPARKWVPLSLAAESSLVQRAGLLSIAHDSVRTATRDRYLEEEGDRVAAHRRLANYFNQQENLTDRNMEELPHQWRSAGDWTDLKDLLTEAEAFMWFRAKPQRKVELASFWKELKIRFAMGEVYKRALVEWESECRDEGQLIFQISELAWFIYDHAELEMAESLMRRLLKRIEGNNEQSEANQVTCLSNFAHLLRNVGHTKEAREVMERAMSVSEERAGPNDPETATLLGNLAWILLELNHLDEAEAHMRRALAIDEKALGKSNLDVARDLNNLAQLLLRRQATQGTEALAKEAETLAKRALDIAEVSLGQEHPKVAEYLNSWASVLGLPEFQEEAEAGFRRALKIDEAIFGSHHPNVGRDLNNLSGLLAKIERESEAEPIMRRAISISKKNFGSDHPTVALDLANLASLLFSAGRYTEAEPVARESLETFLRIAKNFGGAPPYMEETLQLLQLILLQRGMGQSDVLAYLNKICGPYGLNLG